MGILLVYDVTDESSFNSKLYPHTLSANASILNKFTHLLTIVSPNIQTSETGFGTLSNMPLIMSTKYWLAIRQIWMRAKG
jgi:hypothetical protein